MTNAIFPATIRAMKSRGTVAVTSMTCVLIFYCCVRFVGATIMTAMTPYVTIRHCTVEISDFVWYVHIPLEPLFLAQHFL